MLIKQGKDSRIFFSSEFSKLYLIVGTKVVMLADIVLNVFRGRI